MNTLFVVLLFAAFAVLFSEGSVLSRRFFLSPLQGSAIPAACNGVCTAAKNISNTCFNQPLTCECNKAAAQITLGCVQCTVDVSGLTDVTIAQETLDAYTTICNSAGIPIGPLKVRPHAPANGTSTSLSTTPSATPSNGTLSAQPSSTPPANASSISTPPANSTSSQLMVTVTLTSTITPAPTAPKSKNQAIVFAPNFCGIIFGFITSLMYLSIW